MSTDPHQSSPGDDSPSPFSSPAAEQIKTQVQLLLGQAKALAAQAWALALAQWRLSHAKAAFRAKVAAVKVALFAAIALLAVLTYAFAIAGVWIALHEWTGMAFAPPLILAGAHGLGIAILFFLKGRIDP